MNILWLTNIPLPEASYLMKEDVTPTGGWLVNTSSTLVNQEGIKLSVAFPHQKVNKVTILEGKKNFFYIFPPINNRDSDQVIQNKYLMEIIEKTKPDIVHIFGTEYSHSLAIVNICKKIGIKTVISIQGLVSVYARHYMAFLPSKVQRSYTIRDFLKQDNLIQQKNKFIKRGKFEVEAIQKVDHIIGRTSWDKACTSQINPNAQYHFCNETLREEFYKHTWNINKCERHSIFVSQGSYPIKGLHIMLEAMPLIIKRFPNTKLYIGGFDITKMDNIGQKLKISSYAKYIKELIRKYGLEDKIKFTGLLNEKNMCDRYLKSNVFVCPSSIENSPNSLGEAMILGVPCVSSDVGGVTDMLRHTHEGYVYQSDAPYMLAYYVCEIFRNENLTLKISENAKLHARKTHDQKENLFQLLKIYKEIKNGEI